MIDNGNEFINYFNSMKYTIPLLFHNITEQLPHTRETCANANGLSHMFGLYSLFNSASKVIQDATIYSNGALKELFNIDTRFAERAGMKFHVVSDGLIDTFNRVIKAVGDIYIASEITSSQGAKATEIKVMASPITVQHLQALELCVTGHAIDIIITQSSIKLRQIIKARNNPKFLVTHQLWRDIRQSPEWKRRSLRKTLHNNPRLSKLYATHLAHDNVRS